MEAQALDKFEQLTEHSTFTLALLANEATGDWALVTPGRVPADAEQAYKARGLGFAGVLGIVEGQPRSALAMPLEGEAITAITGEFIRRFRLAVTHPTWCCKPDMHRN